MQRVPVLCCACACAKWLPGANKDMSVVVGDELELELLSSPLCHMSLPRPVLIGEEGLMRVQALMAGPRSPLLVEVAHRAKQSSLRVVPIAGSREQREGSDM
jgi:hypothetical protein